MSRALAVIPAAGLALALAGCPGNVRDAFPKSVGFQPLTTCVTTSDAGAPLDWPAPVGADPYPEVLVLGRAPNCGGFLNPDTWVVTDQARGRGFLKAPLATVWARMQPTQDGDPNWIRLCTGADAWAAPGSRCVDSWHWLPGAEAADFPVSFVMRYHVNEIISVDWQLTWREGPLEGTVAAPLAVGARYQKTWGIENLRVETATYVLRPVGPTSEYTSIEIVAWLDADQSDENSVAGTVQNAYNLLLLGVHTP